MEKSWKGIYFSTKSGGKAQEKGMPFHCDGFNLFCYFVRVQINTLQQERLRMSEQELMELVIRAQSGDKKSCYELWQILEPLRNYWVSYTRIEYWNKEDLQQQSYLVLIDSLQRYDSTKGMTFEGYYKTRLKVWKGKQCKRKTCESSNVESVERAMLSHSEGSENELNQIENKVVVQGILEKIYELEESEREFIMDSLIYEKKTPELMKKYGGKSSTLRSKKKRIMDKLKQNLEKN